MPLDIFIKDSIHEAHQLTVNISSMYDQGKRLGW